MLGGALAVFVERRALNKLAGEDIFHLPAASWLPAVTPTLVDVLLALWIGFGIALTVDLFARAAAGVATVAVLAMAVNLQASSNHVTLLVALSVQLGRRRLIPKKVVNRIRGERTTGNTLAAIADGLNADHVPTARGGKKWWPETVRGTLAQG